MLLETHGHAGNEELEVYCLGSLAEPRLSALEEHLLVCPQCQRRVEEMDAYTLAMRTAAAKLRSATVERPRTSFISAPTMAWTAGIAALFLAFAVGLEWRPAWRQASPPVSIALEATRGGPAPVNRGPRGRLLTLNVDVTQLPVFPSYQLEMVSSSGASVWNSVGHADAGGKIIIATSREFAQGIYYVRIYSPSKELLREFALEIE